MKSSVVGRGEWTISSSFGGSYQEVGPRLVMDGVGEDATEVTRVKNSRTFYEVLQVAADAGEVRLPRDLSEDEMALEADLLAVTATVVRSCGDAMPPPLCSRALRLLQAVVVLPAAIATQRDGSWRVALLALCELSGAKTGAAPAEGGGGGGGGGGVPASVSRLAAPLLTAAATRVLSEWAEMSGALADGLLEVRAEQLLLLLSEVAKLRLAAGTLGPSPGATEALEEFSDASEQASRSPRRSASGSSAHARPSASSRFSGASAGRRRARTSIPSSRGTTRQRRPRPAAHARRTETEAATPMRARRTARAWRRPPQASATRALSTRSSRTWRGRTRLPSRHCGRPRRREGRGSFLSPWKRENASVAKNISIIREWISRLKRPRRRPRSAGDPPETGGH